MILIWSAMEVLPPLLVADTVTERCVVINDVGRPLSSPVLVSKPIPRFWKSRAQEANPDLGVQSMANVTVASPTYDVSAMEAFSE
jgi:hypothetical protein